MNSFYDDWEDKDGPDLCVDVVDMVSYTHGRTGGCFIKVSRALQNNLAKIHNARDHLYGENFKLKLCTCAQSMALGTHTKFQLEILIRSTVSAIHKFRENILESSRNLSETSPRVAWWFDYIRTFSPLLAHRWVSNGGNVLMPWESTSHITKLLQFIAFIFS